MIYNSLIHLSNISSPVQAWIGPDGSKRFRLPDFLRCVNVIESTYTNLDSIAYYTPRLYGIAHCS